MFCLKCGKEIDDQAMKCPFCGCPTENASSGVSIEQIDPTMNAADSKGIVAIIVGAVGIVFAWLFALIGWICSIVGLSFALIGRSKNRFSQKSKLGLILSAIALACSLASSIIGVILMT